MIKNLTGGALINYGPTFPDPSAAYDGALFYKNSGTDQGLYIFSLNQDSNSAIVGDQVAQGWYQAASELYVQKTGDTMTGDLVIQSGDSYKGLRLLNTTGQSGGSFGANTGSAAGVSLSGDAGPIIFFAGGTEKFRISANGTLLAGSATVWTSGNDGPGSGLNADLLDSHDTAFFQDATNLTTGTIPLARLPFTPIQQGGGTAQQGNKIYIGWLGTQLGLQVDTTNYNNTGWPIDINGNATTANSATSATNAVNATNAVSSQYIRNGGTSGGVNLTFASTPAQAGNPTYVWGTNNQSQSYVFPTSGLSVGSATNATNATNAGSATYASYLRQSGTGTSMTFNWSGQSGQPTWLWGSSVSDGSLQYVYNPANFVVANTTSISSAVGGSYSWTGTQGFASNANTGVATSSGTLQPTAANSGVGSTLSFHRPGVAGVNMGLDSDGVFRLGGWTWVANRLQIDTSGNLTMSGNVTAYSDRKLKKDIEPITKPLDRIAKLEGIIFTRIDSGERQTGLIAQDVMAVLPEAVHEMPEGTLALAYGNLAGLFVESIKALTTQIAELRAEIAELKGKQ